MSNVLFVVRTKTKLCRPQSVYSSNQTFFLNSYRAFDFFLCSWVAFSCSMEVLNTPNSARKDRNNISIIKSIYFSTLSVWCPNNNLPGGVFNLSSLGGVVLDVVLQGDVDKERLLEWAALTICSARLKLPAFLWRSEETSLNASRECLLKIMLLQI